MLAWLLSRSQRRRANDISPSELETALQEARPLNIIDIRSAEAYAAAHLVGAVNIPMDRLLTEAPRLDPCVPTMVY
jgi:rhodanese-related sulfurtransferase